MIRTNRMSGDESRVPRWSHMWLAVTLGVALTASAYAGDPADPKPTVSGDSTVTLEEGVPGGVATSTITIEARVVDIDYSTRQASLERPDGEVVTISVGSEATRFEEIEVGDMVVVTVAEELVVYVDSASAAASGAAAVTAKGDRPGGMVAEVSQIVATVVEIDPEGRTVTLEFEDGSIEMYPVRADIDLSKHEVGEQVVFRTTEMIAIDIQKP